MSLGFGLSGLLFLTLTVVAFRQQPWLRDGLLVVLCWQACWWLVRLLLMLGIWRREPALSATEKVWIGLTLPVAALLGVWWSRGRLSRWVTAAEETVDEQPGDAAGAAAGADSS
ncbi:MAG: hypothetical protein IT204_00695 [Fimbriimonadaceae bacterium]|nr:hypothetical protein [Fimbriimonadaceae bacterium]